MKAKAVIDASDDLLMDEDAARWPRAQRLRWLNEGQLAIIMVRPDAKSGTIPMSLVAGVKQTIPSTALRLLDVVRNTNGRGITLVSRDVMNDLSTGWYTATGKKVIKHFTYDDRTPNEFDVYPPALVGASVDARCSLLPTDCANEEADIDIPSSYAPALANWICHRAFLRDSESPRAQERSGGYLAAFTMLLTGKTASDKAETPGANHPNRLRPNTQ